MPASSTTKQNKNKFSQDPDTKGPCVFKFLCVVDFKQTFQRYTGIGQFHVTRWLDKTWQEAGSWSLYGF